MSDGISGLRLAGEVVKIAAARGVTGAAAGQLVPAADDRVDIGRRTKPFSIIAVCACRRIVLSPVATPAAELRLAEWHPELPQITQLVEQQGGRRLSARPRAVIAAISRRADEVARTEWPQDKSRTGPAKSGDRVMIGRYSGYAR